MTEHPNYKYRPRRRKHTKARTGPQNGNNSTSSQANNNNNNNNNAGNNNNSASNINSNGTPSSTPSTHNQSSSSEVQYDRMSPYNYSNIYYNDGSTLTSPGQSSPSPSPPNNNSQGGGGGNKKIAFKMEDVPTPQMSPMEMNDGLHSSKIDYEQALPATTTSNYNSNKNHRYSSYDTSNNAYELTSTAPKSAYHYVTNNDRMYESQHQMSSNNMIGDKKSGYSMPLGAAAAATTATTIAAMGNGMYVMCSNRGVLDQGHIVTGTYFPPLPTSQDHQNLGTNSILTSSSHHHYMNTTQTTSSLAGNQIMSGSGGGASSNSNDVKFKSNDSNNNKHGSENNNKTNKMSDLSNGGKNEGNAINIGKNGGLRGVNNKESNNSNIKTDDIDDKLIKNDTNNNNHPDNKNGNNNRLMLSSPSSSATVAASALSPYHHQSYLSQYKNHLNYSDHTATAVISQSQMQDEVGGEISQVNKYGNFTTTAAEYDPYHHQSNAIYYHPTTHFTHSHPSLNTLPPSTSVAPSPTTFYVTNPEYYHQSYAMTAPNIQTSNAPTTATLVQPMVAKIDAVALHHPSQNLIHADPYVVSAEQMKEDDFSNILAGVRKTCYSN